MKIINENIQDQILQFYSTVRSKMIEDLEQKDFDEIDNHFIATLDYELSISSDLELEEAICDYGIARALRKYHLEIGDEIDLLNFNRIIVGFLVMEEYHDDNISYSDLFEEEGSG